MKKLTIGIGLIINALSIQAQDTTCIYFNNIDVCEFNYKTSEIIFCEKQLKDFYTIKLELGDVLCLDLSDERDLERETKLLFYDGDLRSYTLNSKNNVYFSPKGVVEVQIGREKLKQK